MAASDLAGSWVGMCAFVMHNYGIGNSCDMLQHTITQ